MRPVAMFFFLESYDKIKYCQHDRLPHHFDRIQQAGKHNLPVTVSCAHDYPTRLLYIIILVISHMSYWQEKRLSLYIYIYSKQMLKYGKPRSLLELSERLFLCSGNGWCVGVGLSFLVCIQFQKKTCVSCLNTLW